MRDLSALREEINAVDDDIAKLLVRRAEIVLAVKQAKSKSNIQTYSAVREREILNRVCELTRTSVLPDGAVQRIFTAILSANRALISQLNIGFADVKFSLAHRAALKQFGEDVLFHAYSRLSDVLESVESGDLSHGVVLAETQAHGVESSTFLGLLDSSLYVIAEIELESGEDADGRSFARFLVLAKTEEDKTGEDKTSLICTVKERPGALRDILEILASRNISLTKIESKPLPNARKTIGDFYFVIDLCGHKTDSHVRDALQELSNICSCVRIIGSYPMAIGVRTVAEEPG